MLHNKNLSIATPFNRIVKKFILLVAYIAIGIGFFSNYGVGYTEWLSQQGVKLPSIQILKLGGADVWLFMGVVLIVIAYVFKRGIELQEEIDLTV
jgi:hypothetical protein